MAHVTRIVYQTIDPRVIHLAALGGLAARPARTKTAAGA
jgi:hypothetical protein